MTSMNINKPVIQFKTVQAPLTPNLQQIKQRRMKQKQKHKNMILPTCPPTNNHTFVNPPTPKISKCKQGLLKRSNHRSREFKDFKQYSHIHNISNWNQYQNKQNEHLNHNTKSRNQQNEYYYFQNNYNYKTETDNHEQKSNKVFKYLNESQDLNDCLETQTSEKILKENNLKDFLKKISKFQSSLEQTQSFLTQKLQQSEVDFHNNARDINLRFQNLIEEIKEKQHQLTNNIFLAQQAIKKVYNFNMQQIQKIKKSLTRYVTDINLHYEQIIQQIQFQKFVDIIDQYQSKVTYFQEKSEKMKNVQKISIYIPYRQLSRILKKANVQYYEPELISCVDNVAINKHKRNYSIKEHQTNTVRNNSMKNYQKDCNKKSCANLLFC